MKIESLPVEDDAEPDRNKTELTQNVTRLALLWLDGKGFKPVATEVSVGVSRGWVADVGGVILPTQSELVDLKLIRRSPRYDWKRRDKPGYYDRYRKLQEEWNRDLRKVSQIITALIEVKTSVADFRRDVKWELNGSKPTNLCYLAMPAGMIDESKWPKDWGILLYGSSQPDLNGDAPAPSLRCVKPSPLFDVSIEQSRAVIIQLALRIDNLTRYARMRAAQKEIRVEEAERKSLTRICNAITFVLAVAEGATIDTAKALSGIRADLPEYVLERIARLKQRLVIEGAAT